MHVLLEGVVPYELSLMLPSFIEEDYFSLQLLNDRITCFSYSTQEAKNKPSSIKPQAHGVSLNQSCELSQNTAFITLTMIAIAAAQMWALAINLPLIIGDQTPEDNEKWECFLLLLDILQLCTARVVSSSHAGFLEALIMTTTNSSLVAILVLV